jgi:circadian clock protein KaiB
LSGQSPAPAHYHLRLFVAGTTARSLRAIENLRRICTDHLQERVDLEVIDIYQQPELARQHQVVAVPSLVRHLPLPIRRIIGDLSEEERVLKGLEIIPAVISADLTETNLAGNPVEP